MNYYEELGVPRNASKDEIKRAFRKKAQKAHPDKGGDPEKFHAITKAIDTLGDDERRAYYDEHGGDAPKADNNETQAMGLMAMSLMAVVDAVDVDRDNVINVAISLCLEKRAASTKEITRLKVVIGRRERAIARLKKSTGKLAADMLNSDLQMQRRSLATAENNALIVDRAVELLSAEKYDAYDIKPAATGSAMYGLFQAGGWR